ncbi:MAG TPA: phytoene desaturase family protein [Acidobacteriaceae bacterium]|nr:phytoene desaturase family protein [Acidobacteriaceae bacterium]
MSGYQPWSKKHIIIVGAGPGGLASAMLLAQRGFRVQVFEKQHTIGGRNARVTLGEYSFDLGPTFLMMKFLLDELFAEGGRRSSDYLQFRRLDPMYALTFPDKIMRARSEPDAMKAEIERHFPGEGASFDCFIERESLRFKKLYPCLQKPYGTLASLISPTLLGAVPHVALGRSLHNVLADYFRSEELRLAFTFQSKYLGMSPWDCPGLFTMIPYTEHAHGVYHVMGGLSRISEAFAEVAREEGAEIHVSTPVKRILLDGRRSCGVELENGEKILCDDVVINADFGHAMSTLFESERLRSRYRPDQLRKQRFSCSTFMMYIGLDRKYNVDHHTIIFAKNYKKNIEAITRGQASFEDMSLYIRNSAVTDPSSAPEGHSAVYVLVPVANNTSGINWTEQKEKCREYVLRTLRERTAFGDITPHIRQEMIITPEDWEHKHSVFLGATFNMAHSWNQMLYMRPHNEFEEFSNCYLVGGGTHPGSGLPTIFESARIAANLLCQKYEIPHPVAKPLELAHA